MADTKQMNMLKVSELTKTLKHFKYIESGELQGQFKFSPTRFDQRGAILVDKEATILSEHGFSIVPANKPHDSKMEKLLDELLKITQSKRL